MASSTFTVSYGVAENLPDAVFLSNAAERVVTISDTAARDQAVATVFKLIDAVLATPEESKKRRIRKTNEAFHQRAGRHPAALDFLRAAGFVDRDDPEEGKGVILEMPVAYMSRLTDAHHVLARAAREAKVKDVPTLPGGIFNPYAQSTRKVDASRVPKASDDWHSEAEKLRVEVKQREQELKDKLERGPPVALKPTAFWHDGGRKLEEAVREAAGHPEEDAAGDNALIQTVAASKAGPNTFESADKQRLAELAKVRVHQVCVLRVISPDKSVLQVHFRAADTGEHVIKQVGPLLAPHVRKVQWYIYQSPPHRRLAPFETLAAAGLTPGANVYLGFDGDRPDEPFLESKMQKQLGPKPGQRTGASSTSSSNISNKEEVFFPGTGQRLGSGAPRGPPMATMKNNSLGGRGSATGSQGFPTRESSTLSTMGAGQRPSWLKTTAPQQSSTKAVTGGDAPSRGQESQAPNTKRPASPGNSSTAATSHTPSERDEEKAVILQEEEIRPAGMFACSGRKWLCN